MDNTIDNLERELKKAQLELEQIKKNTPRQIAEEQAAAKIAMAKAAAKAYAEGMQEALKKLEQHIEKQHTILAESVAAAEKSAQKLAKAAMEKEANAAKKAAAAKQATEAKKAAAAKKAAEKKALAAKKMAEKKAAAAQKAAAKKAAAPAKTSAKKAPQKPAATSKKPNAAQSKPVAIPTISGSLHEKRLGILEREFSPTKSAHSNTEPVSIQDFANLSSSLDKDDWS